MADPKIERKIPALIADFCTYYAPHANHSVIYCYDATALGSNMKQKLMPPYDKIMLRKRSVIESVNDMLKNVAQIIYTRHRSLHNFIMNILAAMGAYCFFSTKPHVNFDYEIPPSDGQLVIWQ